MNTVYLSTSARPMRIGCYIFLGLGLVGVTSSQYPIWDGVPADAKWMAWVFMACCGLVAFWFAWAYGKYYHLTESGIEHRLLGICYRKTSWTQIQDIMCVFQPTGERGQPRVLMVNICCEQIYRPSENGYGYPKSFWRNWWLGKQIMVRFYDQKNLDKGLGFVQKYYGQIDFDFFGQTIIKA